MRINLVTPFAEKDAVKALGGRWDAAKKCWYIVDVADLAPFARWILDMTAAMNVPGSTRQMAKPKFLPPAPPTAPVESVNGVVDCGCNELPWDDCVHTIESQSAGSSQVEESKF